MKRKSIWILAAVTMMSLGGPARAAEKSARPNILFVLTDDQRWNALGCMRDTNF